MPSECCVGGCKNVAKAGQTWEEHISLHQFPNRSRQPGRYQGWVNFVNRTRKDFIPSPRALVCSRHFTDDSFSNKTEFVIKLSLNMRCLLLLNNESVPSIRTPDPPATSEASTARESRYRHRHVARLLDEDIEADDSESDDSLLDDISVYEVESDVDPADLEDPDWEPDSTCSVTGVPVEELRNRLHVDDPVLETKYIVAAGSILDAVSECRKCGPDEQKVLVDYTVCGAVATFSALCTTCRRTWTFRTMAGPSHISNSQLTAAILFTGNQNSKVQRYMEALQVAFPSSSTFCRNQATTHHRIVRHAWEESVTEARNLCQSPVSVGGDARCDSVGYSAQFGTYTLMDLDTNKILDIHTISKVETNMNSAAMELKGLQQGLENLEKLHIQVKNLVTDRHPSITKFMREKKPDIEHYNDIWHVAKSVRAKLKSIAGQAAAKNELTPAIQRSIINRLYGMAASTPVDDNYTAVMDEKRAAIPRHLAGQCRHPDHKFYKECHHADPKCVIRLRPGGVAHEELTKYLGSPRMRKALCRLSPIGQTSRLESFHSSILSYAPKHTAFPYTGIVSRILMAAIHHNHNCQREVLRDAEGQARVRVIYLKFKGGEASSKIQRGQISYSYLQAMMQSNLRAASTPTYRNSLPAVEPEPPTMTSQLDRTSADVARSQVRSRFPMTQE